MSDEHKKAINLVYELRGERIMIDADVAALFQISLKMLHHRVNKNKQRFPPDFLFIPSPEEWQQLQQQTGLEIKIGIGNIPVVFTTAGVLMVSGLIKTDVAIKISIDLINQFFDLARTIKYSG